MKFWKRKSGSGSDETGAELDRRIVTLYNRVRNRNARKLLCHAPFKSMTFFLAGDVMACWHNKQYLLGHYPKNTIHDIWFGEKIKNLRESIKKNNLSLGCNECHSNFLLQKFHSTGAIRYDNLSVYKSQYPVSMDFQINNICNLECIMCNGEYSVSVRQHREMEAPYINPYNQDFIKQLEPFIPHLREASFSGGEVFLINQYYDIWEKIHEINPSVTISVTSNGTMLNDRIKDILGKLKFNITLSIDSVNKETYEKIRRNGVFEETFSNFEFYYNYTRQRNTNFSVRICPLRQNWKEIPEIFQYFNNKNIYLYFNTVIFPPYTSLWNLNSNELNEIAGYFQGFDFEGKTQIQLKNIEYYKLLIQQIIQWQHYAFERESKFPGIDTFDAGGLISLLRMQINNYMVASRSFASEEKENFMNMFDNVMDSCLEEITDKEQLTRALRQYTFFPVNRLIDEFNIRDKVKIINLTKQAGKIYI